MITIFQKNRFIFSLIFLGFLFGDESWKVYDDSQMAIIEITVDPENLIWIYENVESDSFHLATIHFQNGYIDEIIDSVGFRLRGNTSRNAQKKSFKLDFNHFISGRDFYDVEKINLNGEHNDPSIVRSKLCWDFYQEIGVPSTRASHTKVFINGVYYGLYISVEHIDDTFLNRNYEDDSGNLWKCIWPADLTYRGDNPEDYYPYYDDTRPYELKTNEEEYDYSKLARLIRIINQVPDSLELVLSIKETLQYFAVNILTGSWDDYRFLRNNFYLYHNPSDDLIHWIPYDYDNSFSVDWFDIDWSSINPYDYAVIDGDGRPLTDYLFSHVRYKNLFTHFLEFYINTSFNNSEWDNQLDSWHNASMAAAQNDEWRTLDYGFNMSDFNSSYGYNYQNQHIKQGIKRFISDRVSSLNDQLYYSGEDPFIYEVIPSHQSMLLNDTFSISVSAFGPLGIDNIIFHYRINSNDWETFQLSYSPIENSTKVEEQDRWFGTVVMETEGEIDWYLTAIKNDEVERYPIEGYKSLTIVNPNDLNDIQINELLAINDLTLSDDYGEFDDWIELINHGETPVELDGYYLTDNENQLTKWPFPFTNITIEPDSFLIIWCDNDDEQGDLHTNFKLSSGGEFLAIVSPDGSTILDSLTFPEQDADISYGRVVEEQSLWDYMTPTPGAENGILSLISDITPTGFSIHSVFPNPFNSSITIEMSVGNPNQSVEIAFISLLGQTISTSIHEFSTIGSHQINFDLTPFNMSSGVYFIKINQNGFIDSRKILYLK